VFTDVTYARNFHTFNIRDQLSQVMHIAVGSGVQCFLIINLSATVKNCELHTDPAKFINKRNARYKKSNEFGK
jgi:hypothetical protein